MKVTKNLSILFHLFYASAAMYVQNLPVISKNTWGKMKANNSFNLLKL